MNSLIQELAEQAGYKKDMFGVGHWDMPECKKFVELILQQVMYLFGDEILSMHYLEQECCQDSITLLKSKIQEHFGV